MIEFLSQPWPWYVSGPLLGLMVPILLFVGNKHFGISSSFRHLCATFPLKAEYFNYRVRDHSWNLALVAGTIVGAIIAGTLLDGRQAPELSPAALSLFADWGIDNIDGLQPAFMFSLSGFSSAPALLLLILGGFLVGFGTRYANGCTSGHAIMGLSLFNLGSMVAVIGFFIGGLVVSNFLLPLVLG